MPDVTTISVRRETKELLKEFGKKGDTYDQIIRRLVEQASMRELNRRWNRILEEEKFIPLENL
ncbi:MAG: hypothetical protein LN412_02455 [Candidatus Thermoplasmatota archaeon]|nr:hypothetical protein [Candidatus Thermoplasmatota archaeon]